MKDSGDDVGPTYPQYILLGEMGLRQPDQERESINAFKNDFIQKRMPDDIGPECVVCNSQDIFRIFAFSRTQLVDIPENAFSKQHQESFGVYFYCFPYGAINIEIEIPVEIYIQQSAEVRLDDPMWYSIPHFFQIWIVFEEWLNFVRRDNIILPSKSFVVANAFHWNLVCFRGLEIPQVIGRVFFHIKAMVKCGPVTESPSTQIGGCFH